MAQIRNPVHVVIDMQNGFLNEHSNHIVKNVAGLINRLQGLSVPVVFSRFLNFAGSPYETLIDWDRVQGEPETDIVAELAPLVEELIDKNFYTALTSDFVELIREHDWKTIILSGIATESCVLKTAVDAFELGLRPIVISDACASDVGPDSHSAGLIVLESLIGKKQIMTASELLNILSPVTPL